MSGREQIDALEVLVASDGWALVVGAAQERIDSYTREVLAGDLDHDRYVQACAERAAALGVIDFPHKALEHLRATDEETA